MSTSDHISSPPTAPTGSGASAAHRVTLPVLGEMGFTYREEGGYDRDEVGTFLRDLTKVFQATENERTALRADVAQLKDALEDRGRGEIALDAIGLLSQAQLIADKCIADAEQYARDLVMTARSQYREVLERAEQSAGKAVRGMPEPGTPVPEVEYVRTYAKVAQIQLRAVLDALAEQVDLLGELPQADGSHKPHHQPSTPHSSGELSWEPNEAN